MPVYYIDKPDEMITKIVKSTFPEYKGKKFKLSTDIPKRLDSYWNGGSKDYYAFYELGTGKNFSVSTNHPLFERNNPRDLESLPPGIIIVKHTIFQGKDLGITIYANSDQLAPLLPQKEEITENEKIVLRYTRGFKSSYAGINNYRFCVANSKEGISAEDWESAKQSLISKKLLNKSGAITASGRNAIS